MDEFMPLPEPLEVYPEARFEAAVLELVRGALLDSGRTATVLPRVGFDVAVLVASNPGPTTRWIEVKAFNGQRAGGVGFGNSNGAGPQVDALLTQGDGAAILDSALRWAIVDATRPQGSSRYAFIDSTVARSAVMGEVSRGKQNNFRMSTLREHMLPWDAFRSALTAFIVE